jgi:dTDP-4-dehydrorhamnose reductase
MTRWLVTGAGGMLGRDLVDALAHTRVSGLTHSQLDITDRAQVRTAVEGHDVVVNAAAWTGVDAAETAEEAATRVNADGARLLAETCAGTGARLVHISTDYVFSGAAETPYDEGADLSPTSAYGRSKAAGEQAVRELAGESAYVVRTAWLYGAHGASFVRTMLRLEAEREVLDVVDDQRGQPTWSHDVARRIVALVEADAPAGTYHATSSGETTWCGLARAVFEEVGADPDRVRPTTSEAFPRAASRPAYSVLGHRAWARAGLPPLRDWRAALAEAIPVLRPGC